MRERRRSHRHGLDGQVRLQLGGRHFAFPVADISVSGVGVLLDAAELGTKPGGEVGVCTIESTQLAGPIEAYVSIMRIRRVGHQHLVGLRFESITDEQLSLIDDYEKLARV